MMNRLLVVEDLEDSFTLIKSALGTQHQLTWARSVEEATRKFDEKFDLALIDLSLPDGNGFEICDWIRTQKHDFSTPIIFLTSNNSVESRIAGFTLGGDDYISKPFNFVELKARVEAKLKKRFASKQISFSSCGITLDLHAQKAFGKSTNNQDVDLNLTPIEFKILHLLISEPSRVFSRDEILNKIWGKEIFIYPRSVDTHVSKLRSKLDKLSNLIKSIHGIGYKFVDSLNDNNSATPSLDESALARAAGGSSK